MTFRKLILDNLEPALHPAVKKLPEPRLRKMMDIVRERIRLPKKDIPTHAYFFVQPEFTETAIFKKPFKKYPELKPVEVYKRIEETIKKIDDNNFTADKINRNISLLLMQMDKEKRGQMGTPELYAAFRLAMTGQYTVNP